MTSHNDYSMQLFTLERQAQKARDTQRKASRDLKRALLSQVVCEHVSDAFDYDEIEALHMSEAIARDSAAHAYE